MFKQAKHDSNEGDVEVRLSVSEIRQRFVGIIAGVSVPMGENIK